MAQTSQVQNPFMLMINPEVVIAAMEKSERLSQLNRHLCRPLDKPQLGVGAAKVEDESSVEDDALLADEGVRLDGQ